MARRARRSSAAWALALVLGVPALAEAQTGLFPNAPIRVRRQRPPCATEPPYYKLVRQQYYGYFPTCWRRWPDNWECPCYNPEKPTREMFQESFRRVPLTRDLPVDELGPGPGAEEFGGRGAGRAPAEGGGQNLPLPPGRPDLFDTKPDAVRPNDNRGALRSPAPAAEAPGGVVEAPSSASDPAPATAANLPDPSTLEIPPEEPTANDPTANAAAPVAQPAPSPAMSVPRGPTAPPPPIMAPTARAPQRRGLLGRLFGDRSRRM